tara:strand:+ start:333 stop:527 length:195 start_codon:yes stop_codon:yes gene_type:complete
MSKQVAIDFQLAQQSTHVMLATKSKTNENSVQNGISNNANSLTKSSSICSSGTPFLNKMNVLKV